MRGNKTYQDIWLGLLDDLAHFVYAWKGGRLVSGENSCGCNRGRRRSVLTCSVAGVCDIVLLLDVLDDAAD